MKNNDTKLVHPMITSLIDKKWKHFVYRILIQRFVITFAYLLIFLTTTIFGQMEDLDEESPPPSFSVRFLSALGHKIVLGGAILKIMREIGEMSQLGLREYLNSTVSNLIFDLPRVHSFLFQGSIFLENFLACSFCICIFLVEFLRLFDLPNDTVVLALASLIGWGYMFFFIMPFRFTGPFVIMIHKMLFNDVLRFCIIYLIFLTGFSQSFFILFHEKGRR